MGRKVLVSWKRSVIRLLCEYYPFILLWGFALDVPNYSLSTDSKRLIRNNVAARKFKPRPLAVVEKSPAVRKKRTNLFQPANNTKGQPSQLAVEEQNPTSPSTTPSTSPIPTQNPPTVAEKYAQLDCTILCSHISTQLPRELRDHIYSYLMDRITPIPVNHADMEVTDAQQITDVHWRLAGKRSPHRHCFDVKYVGEESQREIAEAWYRASEFVFPNLEVLSLFLGDGDGKGGEAGKEGDVLPSPRRVRTNVRVDIREFDLNEHCDEHRSEDRTRLSYKRFKCSPRTQLLADLQKLFEFRPGTRITILLICMGKFIYNRDSDGVNKLMATFSEIFPTLRELAGEYRVEVVCNWGMMTSRLGRFGEGDVREWVEGVIRKAKVREIQPPNKA
jgi:hypothetical protein